MPISRPLLIALIGVVLVGAAVLLTRGGGDDAASTASVTPTAPETLQAAAPPENARSGKDTAGSARGSADQERSSKQRGSASRPAAASSENKSGVPREVKRALARNQVAVVFLYQPGAADDAATLRQVRELDAARDRFPSLRERSAVFTAPLTKAADYLGVTGALGVSRAPAIAIMRPNGEVRLLEGYTDGRSLRQHLTDALR